MSARWMAPRSPLCAGTFHAQGNLLSHLVEPSQADEAEGSGVVEPDGDVNG